MGDKVLEADSPTLSWCRNHVKASQMTKPPPKGLLLSLQMVKVQRAKKRKQFYLNLDSMF